ncbi:MAG: SGNH/GDSL hydrolase family protein [Thermoanaerobaculia bacterium]
MSATQTASTDRAPVTFGSQGSALAYVVLGDSTAAGVGADYEDGIAIGTARTLGLSQRVTMTNLGVSGARIDDVVREQLPAAVKLRPDVVLLSVGANDVTHLTFVRSMRASLQRIVRELRLANPAVRIVVTGSPDMGAPPRIPAFLRGIASWRTKRVNRMFEEEAGASNLTLAPIAAETGPLFRRDHSLFAADRFHPNQRGYATWIAVLNRALTASLKS